MNVLKDKEKQFYIDILESFVSKIDKNKPILMENFDFCRYSDENYRIFHGETKLVLVPKNKGARYVVKIPMIREADCDWCEAEADCDWCEAEAIAYQAALSYGVERFFAETFLFYEGDRCKAYLQERTAARNNDEDDDEWYEAEEDWSDLSDYSVENAESLDICTRVIDELLRAYSSEEVEEFLDFCAEEHINDIHGNNYGYRRSNGVPIIYDYSGIGMDARRMRGLI